MDRLPGGGFVAAASAACIVISKQARGSHELPSLGPLAELNERTPGMPIQAFSALTELAPKKGGKPVVLRPRRAALTASCKGLRGLISPVSQGCMSIPAGPVGGVEFCL